MVFKRLKEDIDSFIQRDPAAKSRLEVILCYPGLHALMFYRVAHALWLREWRLLGRFLSHVGKILSGVEIHPGAKVGRRFFIDHGTGVVIGETAEVGDDVTLYQGVTLGGTSLEEGKRHPTLEDGVIVGSGAQVLGPHVIGAGARIGANAVVLEDVPPGVTMVGIPAKMVMGRNKKEDSEFCAYGTPDGMKDPVVRTIEALRTEINTLKNRVEELEGGTAEETVESEQKLDVVSGGR
nr:serine O-acetyltransferase [Terasakiella sp. SH-1]